MDYCLDQSSAPKELTEFLVLDVALLVPFCSKLVALSTKAQLPFTQRIIKYIQQVLNGTRVIVSKRLPWKLLPRGETGIRQVLAHLRALARLRSDIRVEEGRLHFMSSFHPDQVYLGVDDFDGYVAFYFQEPKIAALECAITGNALYILTHEWEYLSHLSKFELRERFPLLAIRVVHDSSFEFTVRQVFARHGIAQEHPR